MIASFSSCNEGVTSSGGKGVMVIIIVGAGDMDVAGAVKLFFASSVGEGVETQPVKKIIHSIFLKNKFVFIFPLSPVC